MKKKQLINEIMGVPKDIDGWVNYFTAIVVDTTNKIIERDQWDSGDFTWRDDVTYPMHDSGIKLGGKELTQLIIDRFFDGDRKGMLTSKTFTSFPLYNPVLSVNLRVVPDNVFEEGDMGDRMAASHSFVGDIRKVKIGKLGKVTIFNRNGFEFDVIIPASHISERTEKHTQDLLNTLTPTVGHELTHSYQTYRQMLGGKPSIGFGKETVLNAIPNILKFKETPSWNHFLHLIYLSLSFESNARVTEIYYKLKRSKVKTTQEALKVLKASPPWEDYQMLKDFNTEDFMDNFDADIDVEPFENMMRMLLPPDQRPPKSPESKEEWYSVLIDKWDNVVQDAQVQMTQGGAEVPTMERVPESAKKDPVKFFRFFEKRFHKKAEDLKRKLAKVVSLVLQEGGEDE